MHKNTQRILSKTLFDLRKKSKLTQKAIADVMGISVAMYSKIELGERTVQEKHILKLAHLLNIDVTEFKILCLADKLYSEVNNYPWDLADKALHLVYNQNNQQQE